MIRTPDTIVNDLHTLTWELMLQEHQQATHPHPVTIDGMERHITEIEKATKEMRAAVARMRNVQHDTDGRTVCEGWLIRRPCEHDGTIPFERSRGHFVMLCRLCHYQETIDAKWQAEEQEQEDEA